MTKNKIKQAIRYIFATDENLSLENRLYISALLLGILISLNSLIIMAIISPSYVVIAANIVLLCSLVIIYWFAKFKRITEPLKIPIIILSFLGIATVWVFDGGMDGPDMMIALLMLILALVIVSNRTKKFIISLFIVVITIIYLIQLIRPDLIVKIPSETNRWFDNFLTAIYCSVFIYLIIRFIHKHYTNERQRAEESLAKFRSYIENAPEGVFVINSKGFYIDVNPTACKLLGYSREEILTMHATQLAEEYSSEILNQEIETLKTVGKYSIELTYVRKDGSTFVGQLNAVKIDDDQFLGFVKDITDHRKAERDIKMLANALKSINECVNITDMEDRIIFVNDSFLKVYGYREEELIGKNVEMVRSKNNSLDTVKQILPTTMSIGWEGELLNIRKDGTEFPVFLSTSVVYDNDAKPIALIGVSSDITKRKQAQDELINLNSQLSKLNTILAHDLKSPFNALLGLSELLAQNVRNYELEKIEEFADNIAKSARNTYSLVDDLLVWTQSQSGKLSYKPQKLFFTTICSEVLGIFEPAHQEKNITIHQSSESNLTVFADSELLKTILRNLISNAIKFTHKGGRIDISTEKEQHYATISVTDNGVGMDQNTIIKLFDITQSHSTLGTDLESGTGLGLLLCKEFVEKHGGMIWVESELGTGSTFKFTIPLSNEA
jgi:PAS domain S-box-containing protein